MLSERRKYNYNIGIQGSSSRQRNPSSSCKPQNGDENQYASQGIQYQQSQSKRITQLQNANKKMLEQTTKQFQKFEADVLKVQGILKIKEEQNQQLEKQNKQLMEDKFALIEALKQKQEIILQFHTKLRQLIAEKQARKQLSNQTESTQTSFQIPSISTQSQTQPQQQKVVYQSKGVTKQEYNALQKQLQEYSLKYIQSMQHASKLEEQIYKLKQEVYVSNSELSIVRQQFSTFKLLNDIEIAKKL